MVEESRGISEEVLLKMSLWEESEFYPSSSVEVDDKRRNVEFLRCFHTTLFRRIHTRNYMWRRRSRSNHAAV